MDHPPTGTPDDGDHDDLAAIDFGAGDVDGETDLGVILGDFTDTRSVEDVAEPTLGEDPGRGEDPMPMFTVTNPPGTVTVTTYMDGRVQQVDLSPNVVSMTESGLAEEIVVIAGLATQDARSAQYTFMLDEMREQGHDNVATRDFLSRDLDLPTPEQAQAARAEVFATRYAGEE